MFETICATNSRQSSIVVGASALAIALAAAVPHDASAQAAAASPDGRDAGAPQEMQEVLVTSQRREERITEVPASVTALLPDVLESSNITDTYEIMNVTPGLRVERLGAYTQPAIRGVTAASTSPGAEANVAVYVDGVYQPNQAANTISLPDIARVEVLKGPQGTLFGRNATGGAILIHTREPSNEPSGSATLSYGRFNSYSAKGFLGAPIVKDKVAFSLSGLYEGNDGWMHDLSNNGDRFGKVESRMIRGKLRFEPAEGVEFTLGGNYKHRLDNSIFLFSALNGNTLGQNGPGPYATKPYDVAQNFPTFLDIKSWEVFLRGSVDISGAGTLSSLTSYADTHYKLGCDADASLSEFMSFTIDSPDKSFAQEINFASEKFGRVSFISGLYYYHDKANYDPLVGTFFGFPVVNFSEVTVRAYAAYAEANFDITDRLVGIAGVRYSKERRTVEYAWTPKFKKSWNATTPRFSLRYELAPKTNVYATYSKGFKSGVYDLNSAATVPVEPEKIEAWEIGVKTAQGLFDLNVAGFFYDYTNMQVQYNNGTFDALQNAGSGRIYGADFEGVFRPTDNLVINAGFAWLHARYRKYSPASVLVPLPGGGNATVSTADLSGYQMSRAPNWTVNLGVQYERELSIGTIGVAGSLYRPDDIPLEQSSRVKQKGYEMLNAQLSWRPVNSHFKFTLWGENLADEEIIQGSFVNAAADNVSYAMPRSYGVSVNYEF